MEKKSSIIAIGLTVHHTPVDVREQLSIAEVRPVLATRKPCWQADSKPLTVQFRREWLTGMPAQQIWFFPSIWNRLCRPSGRER